MRKTVVAGLLVLLAGVGLCEEVRLVDSGGAALEDLIGTDTYITVVLKGSGAMDKNLRVVDVGPSTVAVVTTSNERTAYHFSSLEEIRVQADRVEAKPFSFGGRRSLKAEEQRIVDRAFSRVKEIFGAANANQGVKMRSASLLILNGDPSAREYLRLLADSNDLQTEINASFRLFLAGEEDIDESLISQGLQSGNAKVRARSADLAGYLGLMSCAPVLLDMVKDRSAEVSTPAARALARLHERQAIPALLRMVTELKEKKGEAAIFALVRLGGADVIVQVKSLLDDATGRMRYRLVRILYELGDPLGKRLIKEESMAIPTLAPEAALVLAGDGDWDSMRLLNARLQRPFDEKEDIMFYRAEAAAVLMKGGDPTAISHLQTMLRSDEDSVKKKVCRLIIELGKRKLITLTQPVIESSNADVSLQACDAAIALARPGYRERLIESFH